VWSWGRLMAHSTNFADLTQYIKDETDHDGDTEFATMIDDIIARGQDRLQIALDLEFFRSFEDVTMTAAATTVTAGDWLTISDAYITATNAPLERMSFTFVRMYGGTGTPQYWARKTETAIAVAPSPSTNTGLTFEVQARQPVLNGSNTTNWFTKNAAIALELSCLIEAERFLSAPERKAELERDFVAAVQQVRQEQADHVRRESYSRNVGSPQQPTELAR
jgi:hypothetical protein